MSFLNKNNRETEFKCCPAWLGDEDIFQSSLPKIALNRFFFLPFYLPLKEQRSDLHLMPEGFYKKRVVLENRMKSHLKMFLIKLSGILHTQTEKDYICFYKNSENQTFTFILHIKYRASNKWNFYYHKMFHITAKQLSLQYEQWGSHYKLD